MELISKDEAIMIMEKELQKTAQEDESISKSARLSLLRYLVDKTTVIPTAEERKEGEWLDAGWDGEKCSRCGWSIDDTFYSSQFLYCPNCGAKMK